MAGPIRIPLMGLPNNRSGDTTKDQKYINCYPAAIKNPQEPDEGIQYLCIKRAGHIQDNTVIAGDQVPRGIYYWNDAQYTAYGNKIYKNTTPIITLTTSAGRVGFEGYGSNQTQLFVCDGTDGYIIYINGSYRKINPVTWTATTAYTVGQRVAPTKYNGYTYEVTIAGTSGASEPSWPTVVNNTVVNGTVTFKCIEYVAFPTAEPTVTRANSTAYVLGTIAIDAAYPNFAFSCTTAGTTAGSAPTWNTVIGATTTDGTITWTTIARSTVITGHVPKPVVMDGYIFLLNNAGDLVNSAVEDPLNWPALGYVSAELLPDRALWIERHINHIAVFGENSIEFFYNSGNADGSPLERTSQASILVGTNSPDTIVERDGVILFVANSQTGGVHVAAIEGMKIKPLTNESYNRTLEYEGNDIQIATAYTVRTGGHYFYVLNLNKSDRSLVYDITQKFWHEWDYQGGKTPFVYSAARDEEYMLQKTGSGTVFKMSTTSYQDEGQDMAVTIQTPLLDGNNQYRKFMRRCVAVGDTQTTNSPIYLSYTDDDYKTWSSQKESTLDGYRAIWKRLGSFRRRAFKLYHSANTPLRLIALEMDLEVGVE